MFSLPVGAALLAWMLGKNRPPFRASLRRLVLPTGLLLGLVAVLMGYYFWRVTGSPWRMPHQVYFENYPVAPYFIGQPLRPIATYHHAVMKDFYLNYELPAWEQTRSLGGVLWLEIVKGDRIVGILLAALTYTSSGHGLGGSAVRFLLAPDQPRHAFLADGYGVWPRWLLPGSSFPSPLHCPRNLPGLRPRIGCDALRAKLDVASKTRGAGHHSGHSPDCWRAPVALCRVGSCIRPREPWPCDLVLAQCLHVHVRPCPDAGKA